MLPDDMKAINTLLCIGMKALSNPICLSEFNAVNESVTLAGVSVDSSSVLGLLSAVYTFKLNFTKVK